MATSSTLDLVRVAHSIKGLKMPIRLLVTGLAALLCVGANATESVTRPNVLLLVAEDLSPRIGAFGDPIAQTPNIDALAREGVRFTDTFTTAGVCAPSRAALITGQYQFSFGGQHMRAWNGPAGRYFAQPERGVRAFPELMRAAGYFTFTDTKLDYQFSEVRAGTGPFSIWDRDGVTWRAWRERDGNQPFFGLINFVQTHESGVMRMDVEPYSPSHAGSQQLRRGRDLIAETVTDPADVILPPYYPDLPELRADLARHYDNIRRMDEQVGEIIAALEADGLDDSTIVIWTTDHGDGLPRSKREVLDSGIHVPMILHLPEAFRSSFGYAYTRGGEDPSLVSFVDLAPTILELAAIDRPDYLHGASFLTGERTFVLAGRDRIDEVKDHQRAVRDNRFKYIRSWRPDVPGGHRLNYLDNLDGVRAWRAAYETGTLTPAQARWFEPVGAEQLYDLVADPYELENLATSETYAHELERMRSLLEIELERFGDTSAMPEAELRRRFVEGDTVPATPPPGIDIAQRVSITSAVDASIGYRHVGNRHWQLYTEPLSPGEYEVKAVRYGWLESGVVNVRAPAADRR